MLIGIFGAGAANAQILSGSPVRIQVGNGPALVGTKGPAVPVGVSILSSSYGTTGTGTSVRILGTDKVAGVTTYLVTPGGKDVNVNVVSEQVQALTTNLIK